MALGQSLWLDEAIGALAARNYSYWGIVTEFLTHDNHPPIYYLVLKFWTSIFGYSEISLRMPGVLFGVLVVFLVWRLSQKFAKKASVLATVLVAASPFLIYYSHEVRMYMLTVVFTLTAVYCYLLTVQPKKIHTLAWVGFSLSLVGLLFTDYVPVFLLPVFFIHAWHIKMKKNWFVRAALSFLPLVILGILWLPQLKTQALGGASVIAVLPEWKSVAGGANLKEVGLVWTKFILGRISISPKSAYYALLAVLSIPFAFSLWMSRKSKGTFTSFVRLWLIVPLVLCFLVSFMFPAFVYFRFTFVAPAFFMLVALGVVEIRKDLLSILVTGSLVIGSLFGFYFYISNPTQQRESWREAVSFVESNASENSIALFEFPAPFAPFEWYQTGKVKGVGALTEIKVNEETDRSRIVQAIESVDTIYYFEYLADLTDPGRFTLKVLKEAGFELTSQNGDFHGVGVIHIWTRQNTQ